MSELEAARLVVAGLRLLADAVPIESEAHSAIVNWHGEASLIVHSMEQDTPPWNPEPQPTTERPWSQVSPGDEVQAPNGQWYPVDSWARIGEQVKVLLVGPDGTKIPSAPKASATVPTRRGTTGQAIDIFRAGGLDLEQLGSVAA
jgi:hypothetical protein